MILEDLDMRCYYLPSGRGQKKVKETIQWSLLGSAKRLHMPSLTELYFDWNVTQQETFIHQLSKHVVQQQTV